MAFELQASGGKRGKQRITPSMNVTPLVDVVLVLLIIFMVIAPMMVKQMAMHIPKREEKAADPEDGADEPRTSIVLGVRADGSVWLNKERLASADLPARLRAVFAARTEKLLFFDADDDVPYGRAVEVLDLARGGGAEHIAVLTEPVAR